MNLVRVPDYEPGSCKPSNHPTMKPMKPTRPESAERFTIVCLGDSITCEWEEPKYPTYWQQLLDKKFGKDRVRIISAGINGETAQDGYYRLDRDVISHHPDLVTIMFGHNDLSIGIKPDDYARHLVQIINSLQHDHALHIWLLSPNQIWGKDNQERYVPYLTALKSVAKEKQVPLIDIWSNAFKSQNLDTIYTFTFDYAGFSGRDFIHPNALGHRLIAQYLTIQFQDKVHI